MRGGQSPFCLLLLLLQDALKNSISFDDQSLSPQDGREPGNMAIYKHRNSGTQGLGDLPQSRECEAASPDLEITSSDSKPKAHPFHHATSRTPKVILTCNIGVTNILLELFSKYNTFNTKTLDFKLIRNYNKTSSSQRNILEL